MENKNNFAGIIITVIISVILLTVLPIINSINVECPPCENMPTLYAPTISIDGDTLTITPNSNNGVFGTGYKIYVDDILLDTTTSTTYDLSNELIEIGTYEIYVTVFATGFTDSEPSNVIDYVIEPEPSYPTNVVVFKSDNPRTITPKFTESGITLQYSIDNGSTWTNISSGVTTASSDEIWFRGRATGTKSLYTSDDNSNAWVFSGDESNKLHVYGDLRYLLCDNLGDNTITFHIDSYCFARMFFDCTSLATAPSLPANELASNCYRSMFRGCTSLTTAPSLPANELASDCYAYMFYGCTSLTTVPSLPATTLAQSCYLYMFGGCTSLTTAPSLPATTLATKCYQHMFRDCTSLTTVPSLPATTLADYCYANMFYGCTALKVSETKTGSYQYAWRIPTNGMGTTASDWNSFMLINTGGTFKGNPIINTTYYVEYPPV